MLNAITIPKKLTEMCEARDLCIQQYRDARKMIDASKATIEAMVHYGFPYEAEPRTNIKQFIKDLDQKLWRQTYEKTGLLQYMDRKAKAEFERSLDKNPPEFTIENCRSVLLSTAQDADNMFARGLVEFFLGLSHGHKTNTNEPFKVNKKAIMQYTVEPGWGSNAGLRIKIGAYDRSGSLNDMDRVFSTLDGKQFQAGRLSNDMNTQFNETGDTFEDEYYRIKGFKNGNIHIWFKRQDLLDKANKIIADYYHNSALAA